MNQSINDKGVFKTGPATPGMVTIKRRMIGVDGNPMQNPTISQLPNSTLLYFMNKSCNLLMMSRFGPHSNSIGHKLAGGAPPDKVWLSNMES